MNEDEATAGSVRGLNGYTIGAVDGDFGWVRDMYFHDRRWDVQYFVVDTSHWRAGKRVLISPVALRGADHEHKVLRATLTKAEIASSPDIDTEKPVSRQHEVELFQYFPYYWLTEGGAGWPDPMPSIRLATLDLEMDEDRMGRGDPHLRSAHTVMHYYVHAMDGDMGHVADFLYSDAPWQISHVVVATRPFGPGRKVLVPVRWIRRVSWEAGTVDVSLMGETVRLAPEYDGEWSAHQEYLARVDAYYRALPSGSAGTTVPAEGTLAKKALTREPE